MKISKLKSQIPEVKSKNFLQFVNKRITFFYIFYCLFILCIYFSHGASILDPDFGWHVRMGQIILSHGIPKTDPFSYSMPSYPFVDHEWLTNVFFALLYPILQYGGLAVIFAVLTMLALLLAIMTASRKTRQFFFIPFFLVSAILVSFTGVRPQILDWIFLGFLLWVLRSKKHFSPGKFILPCIFLLWVNLHGGFAIGVFTLAVFVITTMISQKKFLYSLLLLFLICLAVTCINPYGYRIWWEVWMQMSDTSLHWTIEEWMPSLLRVNLGLWAFLSLSCFFVAKYWRKVSLFDLCFYTIMFFAALSSLRNVALWLIIALPLTIESLGYFYKDVVAFPEGDKRFQKAAYIFFFIVSVMVGIQMFVDYQQAQFLRHNAYYPEKAVGYLKIHSPTGRIFSLYGWGGYLIWQLPEKKTFIDGRMPSWRWKAPNKNESDYAFVEYSDGLKGKVPFEKIINKYHINTVLLPRTNTQPSKGFVAVLLERLNNLFQGKKPQYPSVENQLYAIGMRKVYQDNISVIYERR